MTIDLFWDDIKVLNITKLENLYISRVYEENLNNVRKSGFPMYFLSEITLVSTELPAIIRKRLSNINNLKGQLKFKNNPTNEDIEKGIFEYINKTECRRPTDKFSIKIEIK